MQQFLWCSGTDEAGDVDVDEGGHQELAVESVHNATVPRDHVAEVLTNHINYKITWSFKLKGLKIVGIYEFLQSFGANTIFECESSRMLKNDDIYFRTNWIPWQYLDFESALKSGGEESTEGPDDGAEDAQSQRVDHERVHVDFFATHLEFIRIQLVSSSTVIWYSYQILSSSRSESTAAGRLPLVAECQQHQQNILI